MISCFTVFWSCFCCCWDVIAVWECCGCVLEDGNVVIRSRRVWDSKLGRLDDDFRRRSRRGERPAQGRHKAGGLSPQSRTKAGGVGAALLSRPAAFSRPWSRRAESRPKAGGVDLFYLKKKKKTKRKRKEENERRNEGKEKRKTSGHSWIEVVR